MVVVRIQKIIWDKHNTKHIKKHCVSIEEIETIIKADVFIKEGYSGKKLLIGRVGSRILTVIGTMKINKIYVVTARDASFKERHDFYEYEKNKKY